MDSVPVWSQLKSIVQYFEGDTKGALETQNNFTKKCPGISQMRSVYECLTGDFDAAKKTQTAFAESFVSKPIIAVPKAAINFTMGNAKAGINTLKETTRTTSNAVGGTVGFMIGGPVGAAIGGVASTFLADMATTYVTGEDNGFLIPLRKFSDKSVKWSDAVDLVGTMHTDACSGVSHGEVYRRNKTGKGNADQGGKERKMIDKNDKHAKKIIKLRKKFNAEKERIFNDPSLSLNEKDFQCFIAKQEFKKRCYRNHETSKTSETFKTEVECMAAGVSFASSYYDDAESENDD